MKIVILGAGTVGTSVSELLCHHGHSVTVVDHNPAKVRQLNEELDVRAITGNASESSVLFQANVISADLCLAMTGADEVNIVGASLARGMGCRRTVSRVYAPVFRDLSTFDYQRHFRIDRLVSLEYSAAMELVRGIRAPGSVLVENFARVDLEVQEFLLEEESSVIGIPIRELGLPTSVRIGSINRGGLVTIASADARLENGDRVTVIGARDDIDEVRPRFQHRQPRRRKVVIAGGGETGYHLADALATGRFNVVVMESNLDRCEVLSSRLQHATVINCDATRRSSLEEERVGNADIFVACTGEDENNIMACVEARELGTASVMSIVNRPDYANVVGKLGIDHAVSPRQVIAKQVLSFLTTGPLVSQTNLAGSDVLVLEIEVREGVRATEHVLAKLALPSQCLIAAVMREDYVRVPGADDQLRSGDTLVMLAHATVLDDVLKVFNADAHAAV
ncbi:MAG: Trk system potassium transporter TrkA [Planctomycetales bacterium]|nr:Trk system potassium transporter TrkA [Planctomycetales bacterium]